MGVVKFMLYLITLVDSPKYDCPRDLFNSFSSSDPFPSTSNGLTALDPLCGRILSLRMSFLNGGGPMAALAPLMLGITLLATSTHPPPFRCGKWLMTVEIDKDDPSVRLLLWGGVWV